LRRGPTPRPCPVCGPGAPAVLVAEASLDPDRLDGYAYASRKSPELMHHRLWRCLDCGVLYANPAPPAVQLAEAYDQALFDSGLEASFAARTYAAQVARLEGLPRRGALDIGTGDGAFLGELLDAGFSGVGGIEPSRAPIQAAPPKLRRLIRRGMFKPGQGKPASLGLVTCFQTLEHVADPLAVLKGARRLLRPGGAFAAVCHDHTAPLNRLLGRRSPIYDLEHLQLFSGPSLAKLMGRAGFKRVRVARIGNRYPLGYWLRLSPLPGGVRSAAQSLLRAVGLAGVGLSLPVGNLWAVGWRE
jgi:SAM-dependent methyltransferase